MPSFSERIGIKPTRVEIQKESADQELRNELWNATYITYFNELGYYLSDLDPTITTLLKLVWIYHFKKPLDEIPDTCDRIVNNIKLVMIKGEWNELFDLLEFIPDHYKEDYQPEEENETNLAFIDWCNNILEKQLSAYRFINGYLAEVTSNEEISAIEEAINDKSVGKSTTTHLKRALELYSDRNAPDYRNSIKESISAIESYCKAITRDSKTTLGKALAVIERNHDLHSSLKSAFNALYGYTSDAGGIRHALLDESTLNQEDAKFMLVTCSAFINYLAIKSSK